jgi:hypothetical protein
MSPNEDLEVIRAMEAILETQKDKAALLDILYTKVSNETGLLKSVKKKNFRNFILQQSSRFRIIKAMGSRGTWGEWVQMKNSAVDYSVLREEVVADDTLAQDAYLYN